MRKVMIVLAVLVALGLVAAGIANTALSNTSLIITFISGLIIFCILAIFIVFLGFPNAEGSVGGSLVIAIIFGIIFLILSAVAWTDGGFIVVEDKNQIYLYDEAQIIPLFTDAEIDYMRKDFFIVTEVSLPTDQGTAHWKARADFSRADYNKSFTLLCKYGGYHEWKAEVERVFQNIVDRHVKESVNPKGILPSALSFSLTTEEQQTMADLGATINGEVRASKMYFSLNG